MMNTAARRPRNRKDANETHCLNELVIYCVVKIKHDDKVAKQYGLKTFLIPPCDLMLEDSRLKMFDSLDPVICY